MGQHTCRSRLLNEANDVSRARLLASATKESGARLHALSVASLGLRLNDDSLRIAVCLRLGVPICGPHSCKHCGPQVNAIGRHALSCRKSEVRHHRHAEVNDIPCCCICIFVVRASWTAEVRWE